jgi:thiol-disulfide isomerase/thioredoxin
MEKTKKPVSKWQAATFILALVSIVLVSILAESSLTAMKPQKAAEKAIDYINKYLLTDGIKATLVKVENEKIDALYKFTLSVNGQEFPSYVSSDGKSLFASDVVKIDTVPESAKQPEMLEKEATDVDGGFKEIKDVDVCKENEKPIVYFFGSEGCPHCVWEHPIIKSVAEQFGNNIVFKDNVDNGEDEDVFYKYSSGSIPTIVIGCKYYRGGAGEGYGEEVEKENLIKTICRATGNQPSSICE